MSSSTNSGRPLINIEEEQETILGKPVYISPSMPSGSSAKIIVFGDLSHFVGTVLGYALDAYDSGSGVRR